jgi:transcriptional regulator with XRE-family HTH domain
VTGARGAILDGVADRDVAPTLGEIIRRQRELSAMSMRQFAGLVGISNPYLSQIERGLREPSEKVVEAIARNLDVSADVLYRQAGLDPDAAEADEPPARVAIREDPRLTPRQRQALLEVYDAFVGAGRPVRRRRRRPEDGDGVDSAES